MANNIHSIAASIASGSAKGSFGPLSLAEFKLLYQRLDSLNDEKSETAILLLTERALVKFSTAPNAMVLVQGNNLSPRDFEIVLRGRFSGNVKPITLRSFVWTELRNNGLLLVPFGIILWALLCRNPEYAAVVTLNQMIVDAIAVFVSIFVLFTISQNREPHSTKHFIQIGYTHRLIQNDNFITYTAILSLVLAILSVAMLGDVASNPGIQFGIPYLNWVVAIREWAPWLTLLALILLLDCFLSITRYYLRMARAEMEARMYQQIMGHSENGENTEDTTKE